MEETTPESKNLLESNQAILKMKIVILLALIDNYKLLTGYYDNFFERTNYWDRHLDAVATRNYPRELMITYYIFETDYNLLKDKLEEMKAELLFYTSDFFDLFPIYNG